MDSRNRRQGGDPIVELKAVTWSKDSHGLFDYENNQYVMKRFQINNGVKIYRSQDEIIPTLTDNQNIPMNGDQRAEFLLSISKESNTGDKFYINVPDKEGAMQEELPNEDNKKKQNIYLIVRSLKGQDGKSQRGYALNPGDVIKLGRIEYKVIEVQTQAPGSEKLEVRQVAGSLEDDSYFDADNQKIDATTAKMCRYCLMEEEEGDEDDINTLLLYPCKCAGSSGGVHFSCLKNWIKHKIVSRSNNNTATYAWKKLECEVCKEPLPRNIKYRGKFHELISVEKPGCPYIILEKINNSSNSDKKSSMLSLIVPHENDPIRLGRGHQCDLRISDISVSRVHALLRYQNGKFLIFDNESKFGTLILLNQDYRIKNDKAAIQIGRTVFTFVMKYIRSQPGGHHHHHHHHHHGKHNTMHSQQNAKN